MNDLMTDSIAAAAKAQQGGAPASSAGGDDPELRAFLAEADAAKAEMAALRDELSRLRTAHEASRNAVAVGSGGGRAATQAALVQLLGSARRLRARLASMDRRPRRGRDGNGSGKVRVKQISVRDNTRNYKTYSYTRSLVSKILYPYSYPPGTGRISDTHQIF